MRRLLLVLLLVLAGTAAAQGIPRDNALPTSGPPLRTPASALAQALVCRGDVAHASKDPVLLVHGTGSTSEESWGAVYLPTLTAAGFPVCTVQLPERATTDMQVSTEHVVSAVRTVAARRHGTIRVVGHSQGATLLVTALKFWPDLPGLVSSYIGLAPTLTYGATGDVMCAMPCSAPFQQRRRGSAYFAGVLSHPLPAGPAYTTIATRFDEIAAPAPAASHLDGATNVVLQDVCPAKVVDHFGLLVDAAVHALVLDGLTGPGPVVPSLPADRCVPPLPDGVDPLVAGPLLATAVANDLAANGQSEKLTQEPPVRCYVSAACRDVDERGRLLLSARRTGPTTARLVVQAPGTLRVAGRTVALRVGTQDVTVPPGAAALETRTAFYRSFGVEQRLPGLAVPAGPSLPTTGGAPPPVLVLLLLAPALLLRRRPAGGLRAGTPPQP